MIGASGAAVGLILGGALTEYLDWRWTMFVNLILAIPAAAAALRLLPDDAVQTSRSRIDLPGTLTASAGLFALVYGFSNAESHGWGSPVTIAGLAAGVALLATFVAVERRVEHPLLPLRVVADRARAGGFLALAVVGAGMFGVFLFLTYYMQQTLGFSPLVSGLAFLPMMAMIMPAGAIGQTRLLPRFGPRPLVAVGMLLSAAAMLMFTGVTVRLELRHRCAAGPARDRRRPRPDLRPGHGHGDARRRRPRRRRGLGAGQHRTAGRRLDRHRPAEHAGGQRRGRVRVDPPGSRRRRRAGRRSRLHRRPSPGPPRCSRSAP